MKPRLVLVVSLLILLAAIFLITRRHPGQAEGSPATGGGIESQQGSSSGASSGDSRRASERESEPVSDELAAETSRLFLLNLDWGRTPSKLTWGESVGVVQDVMRRMNAAQLEQIVRSLAASGRSIRNDEMSWDDFPLVSLAKLDPMAAIHLYAELWPPGESPGPRLAAMLRVAAEKDPQAVASWARGQAGGSDAEQLLLIRTEVLAGVLANNVKLGFSLMPQVGVTDYRQIARELTPHAASSEENIGTAKFMTKMREFAATLSAEDGAALRQGTMEGIAHQICYYGDLKFDGQMERWPLEPDEAEAVIEALVTRNPSEEIMPWLTGRSRTPFAQAARRVYLETRGGDLPEQSERIRASLGE